jgi:hypothetical protein
LRFSIASTSSSKRGILESSCPRRPASSEVPSSVVDDRVRRVAVCLGEEAPRFELLPAVVDRCNDADKGASAWSTGRALREPHEGLASGHLWRRNLNRRPSRKAARSSARPCASMSAFSEWFQPRSLRAPSRPNLPLRAQLGERAHRFLEWDRAVDGVQLVEVDPVEPQAREGSRERAAELIWTVIRTAGAAKLPQPLADEAALRRDHVADPPYGELPDRRLVHYVRRAYRVAR